MSVTIESGWMSGTLADDTGREWKVVQHRQASTGAQNRTPVPLCLHTTETDHVVGTLPYPSNFQCGDGMIVQHIRLGSSGDAVLTYDRDVIGIEMVGHSKLGLWLPGESTLGPTVALTAWLHKTNRITSGVKRPARLADLPLVLDHGPQAVTSYYRRVDPSLVTGGVLGHVDLKDNDHWDPGSFNYDVFFARVQAAVDGTKTTTPTTTTTKGDDMAFADFKDGVKAAKAGEKLPANADPDFAFGYNMETRATNNPKPVPGPQGPKGDQGPAGPKGDSATLPPGATLTVT